MLKTHDSYSSLDNEFYVRFYLLFEVDYFHNLTGCSLGGLTLGAGGGLGLQWFSESSC